MDNIVNILVGVAGAGAAVTALRSVSTGVSGVSSEVLKASAASLGLGQLATGAGVAAAAVLGLRQALDLGGQLSDLSNRTGESVRNLVILRQALTAAGMSADSAGPLINKLQKLIAGLDDSGEKADVTLRKLGTSSGALKQQSAIDQVETLSKGFSKIQDPAERAAIAMKLFGREGGSMLSLFSDSNALTQASEDAGELADSMQRNAAAFDNAGDRLDVIKVKVVTLAASATQQLLPILEKVAGLISKLNMGSTGSTLGAAAPYLLGAAALTKAVGYLDNKVVDMTLKMGPGLAQNIGFGLSGVTGLLSKLLPIGLAAAVTAAVIEGVTAGILAADQKEIADADRRARERKKRIDALANSRSEDETSGKRAEWEKRVAELDAIGKTQVMHESYVRYDQSDNGRTRGKGTIVPAVYGLNEEQAKEKASLLKDIELSKSEAAKKAIARNQEADAAAERLDAAKKIAAELSSQADAYEKQLSESKFVLAAEKEKLVLLDQQKAAADAKYNTDLTAAGLSGDVQAIFAAETKHDATLLDIKVKRRDVEKAIAAEEKKAAEEAKTAAEKRAQTEEAMMKRRLSSLQAVLEGEQMLAQVKLAQLDADFSKTDAEKWGARRAAMADALKASQDYLENVKKIRDATPEKDRAQADANVMTAQQGVYSAQSNLAQMGPDPSSFSDQIVSSTTSAMNQIGTLAQQVGRMWSSTGESMRTSMGTALGDMALTSGSTHDKLVTMSTSVATAFVRNGAQMVADWLYSHLIMANVKKLFEVQNTASTAAGASARSAVRAGEAGTDAALTGAQVATHAGGEVAKSGSTVAGALFRKVVRLGETIFHGVQVAIRVGAHLAGEVAQTTISVVQSAIRIPVILAESLVHIVKAAAGAMSAMASIPYVGPVLAIAAMAAVLAAGRGMIGGKKDGGLVQGGEQLTWINEEGQEYVFSAPAVRNLGIDRLDAMHSAAKTGNFAGFSSGGGSPGTASAQGGSSKGIAIALVDSHRKADGFRRGSPMETQIIELGRRRKFQVGT